MPERKRGTGSAGRFGPRYGRVARRRVSEIEEAMRREHACPECGATQVSREGTGIWECARCGHTFAGGAYRPETPGGRTVRRSLRAAMAEAEADEAADVDVARDADDAVVDAGAEPEAEGEK